MDNLNYRIYEIDVTDILGFESGWYDLKERDENSITELHDFLFKSLLNKFGPLTKTEPAGLNDFDKALRAKKRKKNFLDQCWSYLYKCRMASPKNPDYTLQLSPKNHLLFQKLFVFKIKQYENGLVYLDHFLDYQCEANFENDPARLMEFFYKCLLQYKNIHPKIVQAVGHWMDSKEREGKGLMETETILVDSQQIQNSLAKVSNLELGENRGEDNSAKLMDAGQAEKESLTENLESNKLGPNADPSGKKPAVPEGYEVIDGKFTVEEIRQFFSFLYQEKSKEGCSFLKETEVAEMFKYGIAIPPSGAIVKRYKLNYNDAFPKKIVEYMIYRFTKNHTSIRKKKKVLRFFASYLTDYSAALSDEKGMANLCDNITGKKSNRMKFAIQNYLPERMLIRSTN